MRHARNWSCCCLLLAAVTVGCIPYTVASTAQTVPKGEVASAVVAYVIPNGFESYRDSAATSPNATLPFSGMDLERRIGVSNRADVGLRIPAGTGLVVTYKYKLTDPWDAYGPALAVMFGGGFVNLGRHAYFEGTLIASGAQAMFTPYGGLRIGQVAPLARGAVSDSPTAGGFLGLRVGRERLGISAEVGFFHDRSATGVRRSNYIIVPAIVIHGDLLRGLRRPRPRG